MKTIFILLTSGFASRNVLQTDIFSTLKLAKIRLVFFVPAGTKGEFQQYEIPGNVIFEEYARPKYLERKFGNFRCLNSFEQAATWKLNTTTIQIKRKLQKKKNLFRYYLYRTAAFILSFEVMQNLFKRIDWVLFPKREIKDFFAKYNPEGVYSTDPLFFDELYFLEYAKDHKIKIISQILSWDNITGRGYLPIIPDKIIVWNEILKNQLLDIYNIKPEQIFISGIPQFDFYFHEGVLPSREEFFKSIGADSQKKLIVYTTGAPANFPTENTILEQLSGLLLNSEKVGFKCQLYVRLSPRDSILRYEKMKNNNDIIFSTAGESNKYFRDSWNPDKKDMISLAASLKYADVVLGQSSTISIEAAIFNTPLVLLDIDKKTSHFYEFNHFAKIIQSGGVSLAGSLNQVLYMVKGYLKDKKINQQGRERIVNEQCFFKDGKSAERIAKYLINNFE